MPFTTKGDMEYLAAVQSIARSLREREKKDKTLSTRQQLAWEVFREAMKSYRGLGANDVVKMLDHAYNVADAFLSDIRSQP